MGQAKLRGTRDQRVAGAQARIEATRPEKLICNTCQADIHDLHPVSTRGLRGLTAIWMGQCQCGNMTFSAQGEPQAVQAFFTTLSENADLELGAQSQDGAHHQAAT